jgi:hypothetical protein
MNWITFPDVVSPARVKRQTKPSRPKDAPSRPAAPVGQTIRLSERTQVRSPFSAMPPVKDKSGFWPMY